MIGCKHDTLRRLAGGKCPICSALDRIELQIDPPSAVVVHDRGAPLREIVGDMVAVAEDAGLRGLQDAADAALEAAEQLQKELAEAEERLRKLDAAAAFRSFSEFVRQMWPVLESVPLEWNWHHEAMCLHAQAMVEDWIRAGDDPDYRQRMTDLDVNVGPISLKSRIWMVFLPAWVWACRDPSFKWCMSSGTPSNMDRDSMACRDLVTSPQYRVAFEVKWEIREDQNRVSKWSTTAGGVRETRGVGASVTGIHADGLICDDPDDAAGVWSEANRREVWLFWKAIGNRLNDPRRPLRVVLQQNLHEQDLSTRITSGRGEGEGGVPRLAIPVEWCEKKRAQYVTGGDRTGTSPIGWRDPRVRDGDVVHAVRFTPTFLAAERVRLGSHGYEAQYNCDPSPESGGLFERGWFRYFVVEGDERGTSARPNGANPMPARVLGLRGLKTGGHELDLDKLTITVDATFGSTSDTASAVGLLCVGLRGLDRFVFDDQTKVMTFRQTVASIRGMIAAYPVERVLIELKANGAAVIEELEAAMRADDLLGSDGKPTRIVVESITPEGGKLSRAQAMVAAVESGTIYLLDGARWLIDLVAEICMFPRARRDDRVDALSQLMTHYRPDGSRRWKKRKR